MKKYFIAYLFLLSHAIGLQADNNQLIGAGLFLGSIAAHKMLSDNQPKDVDPVRKIIEDTRATDTAKHATKVRIALRNEKKTNYLQQPKVSAAPLLIKYTDRWHDATPLEIIQNPTSKLKFPMVIPKEIYNNNPQADEIERLSQFNDQTNLGLFLKTLGTTSTKDTPTSDHFKTQTANNNIVIAHEQTFIPHSQALIGKPKIFVIIHGTIFNDKARSSKSFGGKPEDSFALKAMEDAVRVGAISQVLTVKWNGRLDENARKISGQNIAKILKDRGISSQNYSIEFIAYSYGCRVARHAIRNLPTGTVETLWTLASPNDASGKTDDVSDKTQEIHIYGDLDGIATAANYEESKYTSTQLCNPYAHTNIRRPDRNHKTIKDDVRYLNKLKKIAYEKNPDHKCLYARVTTHEPEENPLQDQDNLIGADTSTYTIEASHDPSNGTANRPTFAQAAASEAASNGVGDHIGTRVVLSGIGLLERLLARPESSSSDSSPSPTASPK
jgi:hypothetical protein